MIQKYNIEENKYDVASFDSHLHTVFEVNFVLTDNVRVITNDNIYDTKRGDVFIFKPFSFHAVNSQMVDYTRNLMFFDERVMTESMPSLASAIQILKNTNVEVIHLSDEEIDQLSRLFSIASNRQNQSRKGTFYDFENICAFGEILSFLVNRIDTRGSNISNAKKPTTTAAKILVYIAQNIDGSLTVEELCEEFDMSKTALWKLMKNTVGMSMKEYVINLRISKASNMLINGVSVTEVSNRCGFNSYAHFIRTFTKKMGISPYKYGKIHNMSDFERIQDEVANS